MEDVHVSKFCACYLKIKRKKMDITVERRVCNEYSKEIITNILITRLPISFARPFPSN